MLKQRMKKFHARKTGFSCPTCNKFSMEKHLQSHKSEVCKTRTNRASKKPLQCVKCGKSYRSKSFLKITWTQSIWTMVKNSNAAFVNSDSTERKNEMKLHWKKYQPISGCCICTATFNQGQSYAEHLLIHSRLFKGGAAFAKKTLYKRWFGRTRELCSCGREDLRV